MRSLLVSSVAALALATLAPSQDVTGDTVTLKNGDRLTGTISSVTADQIVIETAATAEITVQLAEVANVTTAAPLGLQTEDGERIDARIQALSDGNLRIGAGAETRDVPASALVTRRADVEWSGSVNVGGSLSTGNTERRGAAAAAEAIRRTENTRLTLRGTWDYGEQKTRGDLDGNPATPDEFGPWELSQRRTYGSAKYDHFLVGDLYAWGQVSGENDRFADLELRLTYGAGLGYQLVDSDDFALQGEAGLSYVDESRYSGNDNEYLAARIAYQLRWDFTADTGFLQDAEFYPSLEDQDDFYARVDSRLRTSLLDDMFAQVQHVFDYDNSPSPGLERQDHRFILSLGWVF